MQKNNSNNYYIIYFLSQSYNHHMDNDMIYNIYILYIYYIINYSVFFEFLQISSLKDKNTNAKV